MRKKIVLLSDGTGNSSGKVFRTNVWRLYQALNLEPGSGQIAYYDDGVGTSSFKPLALFGGAFGYGLKRNVLDLYQFVCRNYQPGDEIYCFGFSRGAFTVRVLTQLITEEGLPQADPSKEEADLQQLTKHAYREYRRRHFNATLPVDKLGRSIRDFIFTRSRKEYARRRAQNRMPVVSFLGVWDTVAAYGLPIDELTRALNFVWRLSADDRNPPPPDKVLRICHAVALDDERNTFHPILFNEENEPQDTERLTQVWFTGMHSNVGGGYPDDGLAMIPLLWMMDQAGRPTGLQFRQRAYDEIVALANLDGPMTDSRRGLGGAYRYLPRNIERLNQGWPENEIRVGPPKIHESVIQRIRSGVNGYAPIGLPARYTVVDRDGKSLDSSAVESHAAQRVQAQELVWDWVWVKRVVYFSTVFVAGALLIFPYRWPPAAACEGSLCFFESVFKGLRSILPDAMDRWLAAYQVHPENFYPLAAALWALLGISAWLQRSKVFDNMRRIWRDSLEGNAPQSTHLFGIRSLRKKKAYDWTVRQIKIRVAPAVIGAVALIAILGAVGRFKFQIKNSLGYVCSTSKTASSNSALFPTNEVCWKVPFEEMKAGKRYRITIQRDAEWFDDTIPTDVSGFDRRKMGFLLHAAAFSARRHLTENWFQPIARIGTTGHDEYALLPIDSTEAARGLLRAEIKARRDGPLFLFVNDVVLPAPNDWQWFYRNNHGTASVTVEKLD